MAGKCFCRKLLIVKREHGPVLQRNVDHAAVPHAVPRVNVSERHHRQE